MGAATSAYQIEGATGIAGRAPSIWDRFCEAPGNIEDGRDGKIACNHYKRWREDIALMAALGLDAYRLSVAWPRILPEGRGALNSAGLDFYDRLVDGLLEARITPFVTLYHWDLPATLQDQGGWANRRVTEAFADFASVVGERLGDRVEHWITQNEPWCAAILGHAEGAHAPGHRDHFEALTVAHHLLLSHGAATQRLREVSPHAKIGLSHMFVVCMPASESEADADAARRLDGTFNRWFLDPLYGRGYPEDIVEFYRSQGALPEGPLPFVVAGDMDGIATETDFLGINYYTRAVVRSQEVRENENLPRTVREAPADAQTDMGWEVWPKGLGRALSTVHETYRPHAIYVTENGAAYSDGPDASGQVHDARRIAFLDEHIEQVDAARKAGIPVLGYFAWSLLDNFEWSFGYAKRFGLVHVDFETGRRTLKDSAHWYRDEIARRRAATTESPT